MRSEALFWAAAVLAFGIAIFALSQCEIARDKGANDERLACIKAHGEMSEWTNGCTFKR